MIAVEKNKMLRDMGEKPVRYGHIKHYSEEGYGFFNNYFGFQRYTVADLRHRVKQNTGVPVKALEVFSNSLNFPTNVFLAPTDGFIVRFGADLHKESLVQDVSEYAPQRQKHIEKFRKDVTSGILSGVVDTVLLPVLFEPGQNALNLPHINEKHHAALLVVHINRDKKGFFVKPIYYDSYGANKMFQRALLRTSQQLRRMLLADRDARGSRIPPPKVFPNE